MSGPSEVIRPSQTFLYFFPKSKMEVSLRKAINLAEQFLSVKNIHQGRVHACSVQSHAHGCSVEQRQKLVVLQVQGIEKVLELGLAYLTKSTSLWENLSFPMLSFKKQSQFSSNKHAECMF